MNFEPQRFFIGMIDFFSIVMPGAVMTYLTRDWANRALFGHPSAPLEGNESWIVFLFVSYLVGHIIFLLGSRLDEGYDWFRRLTYSGQIERLARGQGLSDRRLRWLATKILGKNPDEAVIRALRIKWRMLEPLAAQKAINTFQWSKAHLSKEHPAGLEMVQRFEADSKFFRSFVVILAFLVPFYAFQSLWLLAIVCAGVLLLAIWRYVDQRFKATQQAYWLILALEGMRTTPNADLPGGAATALTHAGAVVFRKNGSAIEYLLVHASNDRNCWVVPEGRIEAGEEPRAACVREVQQLTGHWARVVDWIKDVRVSNNAEPHVTRYFLMESVEPTDEDKWPAENRGHKWLALAEPQQRLQILPATKNLLGEAKLRVEKSALRQEESS